MEKMKYNISARTTILIGRESVSRADGAIIELIKNTYDADADFCYIAFDVPNDKIYIMDNGTGMTRSIIENYWMLIGTDNKKFNYLSTKKRVKSGEKGIGRFALDRLGSKCTMYTKSKDEKLIYWFNDWNKFEELGKSLNEIEADFSYLDSSFGDIIPKSITKEINDIIVKKQNEAAKQGRTISGFSLETGTLFIIEGLRDKWSNSEISKILSVLGFLVPPGEQTQYYIFAQKSMNDSIEEIECDVIDDYDYKVKASFDGEKINASIYRNEFDLNVMPKELFNEKAFESYPYDLQTFIDGEYHVSLQLSELMHTIDKEFLEKAKEIGAFDFQYVFMKLRTSEKSYYSKSINPKRQLWMEQHSGIKIYRDNFIIRPYGDAQSKSYDWLGLDARKGANPVAVSDKSEQWHVRNSQIQGTVLISRTKNTSILDKSSREGIIENEHFEILSNILIEIISLFEKDRSYIAHNIKKYLDKVNQNETTKEQASEIAKKVLKKQKYASKKNKTKVDENSAQLAKAVKIYEEEREELISEIKLLRALATNGLMTTTMVHDLKTVNSLLVSRVNGFRIAIKNNNVELIERNLNDLKYNDEFLKSWISVITTQSNRDRRRRLKKDIVNTIESCTKLLMPILNRKQVSLVLETNNCSAVRRIFETDFDSILYNLIINSIESFEETNCVNREIKISLATDSKNLIIKYKDNGHGLTDAFRSNPYNIFKYGTTSKYDNKGNQIGTGLGMYIVASSITEYNGTYNITEFLNGFGIDIIIPI